MLSGPYRHRLHEAACVVGANASASGKSIDSNGSFMVRLKPEFSGGMDRDGWTVDVANRKAGAGRARDQSRIGTRSGLVAPERSAVERIRHPAKVTRRCSVQTSPVSIAARASSRSDIPQHGEEMRAIALQLQCADAADRGHCLAVL